MGKRCQRCSSFQPPQIGLGLSAIQPRMYGWGPNLAGIRSLSGPAERPALQDGQAGQWRFGFVGAADLAHQLCTDIAEEGGCRFV